MFGFCPFALENLHTFHRKEDIHRKEGEAKTIKAKLLRKCSIGGGKDVKATVFSIIKSRSTAVGNHIMLIIITRWPSALLYIHGIYAAYQAVRSSSATCCRSEEAATRN